MKQESPSFGYGESQKIDKLYRRIVGNPYTYIDTSNKKETTPQAQCLRGCFMCKCQTSVNDASDVQVDTALPHAL